MPHLSLDVPHLSLTMSLVNNRTIDREAETAGIEALKAAERQGLPEEEREAAYYAARRAVINRYLGA